MRKKTLVAGLLGGLLLAGGGRAAGRLTPGDSLLAGYAAIEPGMSRDRATTLLGESNGYREPGALDETTIRVWAKGGSPGRRYWVVVDFDLQDVVTSTALLHVDECGKLLLREPPSWWERWWATIREAAERKRPR